MNVQSRVFRRRSSVFRRKSRVLRKAVVSASLEEPALNLQRDQVGEKSA